jgi:hypothetical protein
MLSSQSPEVLTHLALYLIDLSQMILEARVPLKTCENPRSRSQPSPPVLTLLPTSVWRLQTSNSDEDMILRPQAHFATEICLRIFTGSCGVLTMAASTEVTEVSQEKT